MSNMRTKLLVLLLIFFANHIQAQDMLTGGWLFQDSATRISIIFKKENNIWMYVGKNAGGMLLKDFKRGTYIYNDSVLNITWSDGKVERRVLIFKDEYSLILSFYDPLNTKVDKEFKLRRVVDVEIPVKQ